MRMFPAAAALLLTALAAPAAPAQQPMQALSIPDTADTPWPGGPMTLDVDASDIARGVFRVNQTVPLAPGTRRITLLYPEWEPGHHAPRGPISQIVDLHFSVGGQPVAWRRDPVELYAFHIDLPEGARELAIRFLHPPPLQPSEGRVMVSDEILALQWEHVSFYPAGHNVQRLRVRPSATFPAGWRAGTALDGQTADGGRVSWAETDYETLVDSPVFAGQHVRRWVLGKGLALTGFAQRPELLGARIEDMANLVALGDEALALFGKPPFDRYEFLVALTDALGVSGIEHRRSAEIRLEPGSLADWKNFDWNRNVIAHELVHAWNGKYRVPEGLLTPDFRQPMRGNLLWLYEGQTQFWGHVLSARSGVQAKEVVLGMIASQAGSYAEQPGRSWRSLEDTGFDPVFAARRPKPYASLARGEDYYNEGLLVWLEADQIIRSGTRGVRGLDDFARAFFAVEPQGPRYRAYDFAEVARSLNSVYAWDWETFLRRRFEEPGQPPPLAGIERGGYRLIWKPEPNPYDLARMADSGRLELTHSLGITLDRDGNVSAPQWGSPAVNAGIVTGARVVAVNGVAYSHAAMRAGIAAAQASGSPIELLVRRGSRFSTVAVNWTGGLRWPWLERAGGIGLAGLDRLLASRRNPGGR
ncbi:MAG TPA: peptidase M61 [Novosphingobium sp.]|nr:peptidase M61 [Novosphingobium sp.]